MRMDRISNFVTALRQKQPQISVEWPTGFYLAENTVPQK